MLYYLATPYAADSDAERSHRAAEAARIAAELMNAGYWVFSPIVHNHALIQSGATLTPARWLDFDEEIFRHCDVLIVVQMPGWEKSKGVRTEMEMADRLKKPILYINPRKPIIKGQMSYQRVDHWREELAR